MAGPIFCVILVVDCLFFQFLEWFIPRNQLDFVDNELTDDSIIFDRYVICWRYKSPETKPHSRLRNQCDSKRPKVFGAESRLQRETEERTEL